MNVDAILRLVQSPHNYEADGNKLVNIVNPLDAVSAVVTIGSGAPGADTEGLVYIRTDGTNEDTRLYLRGDPAANDWNPVLGGL